jgi:hypothetical protein
MFHHQIKYKKSSAVNAVKSHAVMQSGSLQPAGYNLFS